MATPYQQVIEIVSKGATSTLKVLNNIEKSLTNIFKKQEAVNRAALKFNKVRAATRRVKGSGLNLGTSEDRTVSSKASAQTKRYTEALNRANKQLNAYVRSLATADGAQNKFTGSSRKITAQTSALQERLNSLSRSNKEYTATLQATLRGEQALFNVQRNRAVDELAQFPEQRLKKDGTPDKRFKRTGVIDLVSTTIAELDQGKIANSINGLDNYIGRLEALRAKVQIGSKSFNALQQQIALVNLRLKEADPLAFSSKIQAAAKGPATKLDSIDAFRQKERFASDLNREEDKRLRLLSRINDSSLAEVTKQKLKNQLSQTDVQLQQKELELAKATNKEVDKELSSLNKKQQRQKFRAGRKDRITQSALIGGGFPFLFGGGPLQALAGGLGGGIGEAISPGGGFAGSIAATAVVSQISQAVGAVAELGKALNPFTADIGKLTQALGIAGTAEGARLQAIEALSGKQAALAEATRLMNQQLGIAGTKTLKVFGEKMKGVGDEFSKLMTKLGAVFARLMLDTGILDFLQGILRFVNNIDMNKFKGLSQMFLGLASFDLRGFEQGVKTFNTPSKKDPTMGITTTLSGTDLLLGKEKDKRIDELAILEATITGGKELGNIEEMRVDLKNKLKQLGLDINKEDQKSLDKSFENLNEQDKLIDGYKRQLALAKQIKSVLAEGMSSAIEGLITGTKSLSESFSQMLRQFGSLLLKTGISNMMGGLNFGSFFGKGVGSAEGNYLANGIRPFASGGMVTRPTMGLVGEAGEDEYVIPASKMAQSMQRYSAGARGESVIPGTGSTASGGGAGIASTTVNYSGPILNFNSEEFVPKSAIGQIINSAASRGAKAGEARTLSSLQNSRSRRSNIGL